MPCAEIDVRLVGTVKIRPARDAQTVAESQLLHGGFIGETVGGIDSLQPLEAAYAELVHQVLQFGRPEMIEQRVGQNRMGAIIQEKTDGLEGRDLFFGNKAGSMVSHIFF